jgi:hypothetical protein
MRIDFRNSLQLDALNPSSAAVIAAGLGLIVCMAGYLMDLFVLRELPFGAVAVLISDGLTGFISAILTYKLIRALSERHRAALLRLALMADMHRQLKSALDMMSDSKLQTEGKRRATEMSIQNVESTLRHLISQLEPISGNVSA